MSALALLGVTATGVYIVGGHSAPATDTIVSPPARKATRITYADGSLYQLFESINGVLDGMWEQYWPNGKLAVVGTYIDGVRHGCWLYMDDAGVARMALHYRDGKVVFTVSEAALEGMGDGK